MRAPPTLHLLAPGPLDQRTGGYLYDARMMAALRERGWRVIGHALAGAYPVPDVAACASVGATLGALADGATLIIDGLALAAATEPMTRHRDRLRILALIHHPLSDETGLAPAVRAELAAREAAALRVAHGVVVTSRFTARGLARFGIDDARIRVATPGTDPVPAAVGPEPGAAPRLLVVASVVPRKGHDVLVRALAQVAGSRWACVCAGSLERDPDHAAAVLAAAQVAGLGHRVRFVGECDGAALERHYATSSLFVLPSHYEGYGMVLAEALARGLAVVSTTGGAIPETVPAAAGVLVSPGDADELAAALGSLLDRPSVAAATARRAALAAAARRHAASLPDWTAAGATFAAAVEALVATPAAPG